MKFVVLLLSMILFATPVLAKTITATWDHNPISDNIMYYSFYLDGAMVLGAEAIIDNTVTVQLASDLTKGEHSVTVTATNIDGESDHSLPATFNYGRPGRPGGVKVHR
jgi:hypothetical protein